MEKLSIHRALAELKLLDNRINNKMKSTFVQVKRKNDEKIGGVLVCDIEKNIKSDFDSISDLINRRAIIKSAIIKSNAITEVDICGEKMTIAEVIDRESSINYDINFLNQLTNQYNKLNSKVILENESVFEKARKFISELFSDKNTIDTTKIKDLESDFIEKHSLELVNPIGILEVIESKRKYIEDFRNECDFVKSESNALTFIEI